MLYFFKKIVNWSFCSGLSINSRVINLSCEERILHIEKTQERVIDI